MKAVFINHCHPDVAHVCGLRAGRFAQAMAERGHQIVVLSQTLDTEDEGFPLAKLSAALQAHDWRQPFVLPCHAHGFELVQRARNGQLMAGWRQAVIAWSYLMNGGMFPDWQAGTEQYFPVLAESFQPDVIWGTFGNTDTWRLCQQLARLAGCPWVGDFKDNWRAFVPNGLQTLMAGRFVDAARMTVFSQAHCEQSDALFPHTLKTILYSGVDDVADAPAVDSGSEIQLLLTGSIYDAADLGQLMKAINAWARRHPERPLMFRYAGNDGAVVKSIAASLDLSIRIEGFLPQHALHRLQSQSMVNFYIHNPRCLMHHKALELLAQGRPAIAYPGETAEVKELAAGSGGSLFACTDPAEVTEALDMMTDNPPSIPSTARRRAFTWGERSAVLETVLADAIDHNGASQ
jgi:hypothetical protein